MRLQKPQPKSASATHGFLKSKPSQAGNDAQQTFSKIQRKFSAVQGTSQCTAFIGALHPVTQGSCACRHTPDTDRHLHTGAGPHSGLQPLAGAAIQTPTHPCKPSQ